MPPPSLSNDDVKKGKELLMKRKEKNAENAKYIREPLQMAKVRFALKLGMNRDKLYDYKKSELVKFATKKAQHFNENIRNIEGLTKDQLRFYIRPHPTPTIFYTNPHHSPTFFINRTWCLSL